MKLAHNDGYVTDHYDLDVDNHPDITSAVIDVLINGNIDINAGDTLTVINPTGESK